MASPILWQNPDRTVTLIDVSHSILAAQGTDSSTFHGHLLSCPPLQNPFPSNEPKSDTAKAKLRNNTVNAELHAEYQVLLHQALEDVRRGRDGEWCLPRPFVQEATWEEKKWKPKSRDESFRGVTSVEPDAMTSEISTESSAKAVGSLSGLSCGSIVATNVDDATHTGRPNPESREDRGWAYETLISSFSSESDEAMRLQVVHSNKVSSLNLLIPPHSNFYLGDCAHGRAFHDTVRKQAQHENTPRHFDFILLDPPWPSRSVKRTHKTAGSTYATFSSLLDTRELILDTEVDMLMANDCLVGVWITNKQAVRDLVLGEDGVFECWGVELVEEWLWLKTTVQGEPVTPLDGLWRKPYEVLLLGRKRRGYANVGNADIVPQEMKRRVIISVPDLHSRKPCLKKLVESLVHAPMNYRALEVFARHLVAGWWSWGDECINFNREEYWQRSSALQEPAGSLSRKRSKA